jgi:hypothetical protein
MELDDIPLLDHHCHTLRRAAAPLDADGLRRSFSESRDPAMAAHTATAIAYQRALRDLAALLGCAPDEGAILTARAAVPFERYARRLFAAAGFSRLLVDSGFGAAGGYDLADLAELAGVPAQEVLRLETLIERLIAEEPSLERAEERLRAAVRGARAAGVVALKSIAAYRGGLHVARRSRDEAAAAFAALRAAALAGQTPHLRDRRLLDYLLRAALEEAATAALPVQFHVGLGDDDADLRHAGPLDLRALLIDDAFRRVPFVLLHCYPFVRQAGYLASIYSNVYVDLSLTIPLTAHGGAAAFAEALELAPVSKLLFATDAHSIPELFYIAARHGRQALGQALGRLAADGWLTLPQARAAATAILHDNAARVYR